MNVYACAGLMTAAVVAWLAIYRLPLRSPTRQRRLVLWAVSRTRVPARLVLPVVGTILYLGAGISIGLAVAAASGVSAWRVLAWHPSARGVALIVLAMLGANALTGFATYVLLLLRPHVDIAASVSDVRWIRSVLALPGRWRWIVPMISAAVEEAFFRGIVLAGLMRAGAPAWAAVVISGALFVATQTVLTSNPVAATVLATSSVVLATIGGLLTLITGSALPAIVVHASFAGYYTSAAMRSGAVASFR